MSTLNEVIAAGGEIDVRFMRRAFELFVDNVSFAEMRWEKMPSGRAFYDVGEARYEITVSRKSRMTWKRTVQVRWAGGVVAELHLRWAGSLGDVITSNGHVYTLRSSQGRMTVARDVGRQTVLT